MGKNSLLFIAIAVIIFLIIWISNVKNKLKESKQKLKITKEKVNLLLIFLNNEQIEPLFSVPYQIVSQYQWLLDNFFERMLKQENKKAAKDLAVIFKHRRENDFVYKTFQSNVGEIEAHYIGNILGHLFLDYLNKLKDRATLNEVNHAGEKYLEARNLLIPCVKKENREKVSGMIKSFITGNIPKDEESLLIFQAELIQLNKILNV